MSATQALDSATRQALTEQVRLALAEDIGQGDLTAALLPTGASLSATIVVRQSAVLCGAPWVEEVFRQLDASTGQGTEITWQARDGDSVSPNTTLCTLRGNAATLLSAERTALNFLQLLSATATATARYVAAVAGTGARILDTRKTLPGLRLAQKYAVRCGGGSNHRLGLHDAILIKENHIAAAGSIANAVAAARQETRATWVEVEVENLDELDQALAAGAERLLLDNFTPEQLRAAVSRTAKRARLEASGGVDLAQVRAIAETGVDDISVGDITKNVQAVDLSMRFAG